MTRPFRILLVLILVCLVPTLLFAKDLVVKRPPASMDKLYPPVAKEPKWIQQMHKMSGTFGGVFVNMAEKDWENAEKKAQSKAITDLKAEIRILRKKLREANAAATSGPTPE